MPNHAAVSGSPATAACELCHTPGGVPVWSDAHWRVIRVEDVDFPAFYRVIAQSHVGELSALEVTARARCMALVVAVEATLLRCLAPTKINLAALGNMVPHLHWHVVARFEWDSHFPQPIWGARQRALSAAAVSRLRCPLERLDDEVRAALAAA